MANPGKKDHYKKKQDPLKPWGRTFRLRPIHHVNDAVEVKIMAHGTECAKVVCPPLTNMSREAAAKLVFRFAMEINRRLQLAFEREASRGPTNEGEWGDDAAGLASSPEVQPPDDSAPDEDGKE